MAGENISRIWYRSGVSLVSAACPSFRFVRVIPGFLGSLPVATGNAKSLNKLLILMVLPVGIEPTTSPLPRECSTTELRQRRLREKTRREIHEGRTNGKAGGRFGAEPARLLLDKSGAPSLHPQMDKDSRRASRKGSEKATRQQRLAEALRENLRRRKEQARAQERLGPPPQDKRGGARRDPPA